MYAEANEFFGLKRPLSGAGYYETDRHRKLCDDLKTLIQTGGIYALTGMVGSGKTTLLGRMENELQKDGHITVSRSLSTEKKLLSVSTIYLALFYDIAKNEKNFKIPTQGEKRERQLIGLMKKQQKPVALFIDEAHDIHNQTLTSLKRIVEVVASSGCKLSIVLASHPKLKNALSKASIEEIGARAKIFSIDDAIGNKEKYIEWLLKQSLQEKLKPQDVITLEASQRLASLLLTPLQIEYYLTRAIQSAYQVGEKPITPDLIDQVLLPDLNSLEAMLSRNGYQFPAVCELLRASSKEAKDFLYGKSNSPRKNEFLKVVRSIGIVPEVMN